MTNAEDFIYHFDGNQRRVMQYFHILLTEEFNLTPKNRFNLPFYYGRSWICYLNPTKEGKTELGFIRGNELSNVQGLLESRGRKQVYSVVFDKEADIPLQAINEIIHEAILLDETKKYKSKRRIKGGRSI
jgi:hypothetical protein